MIQLPSDLAEVLKVIQSNEDGKAITFPDSNEDLLGDLAVAWEKWNTFAETRIGAIVANAKLAMEAMEGEAAESFARYFAKYGDGDGSHANTTVSAGIAVAQALRGGIEAVTQTKNEMIRELQYTKEYIADNPAGKNDDIAKSEGIKEAVSTYNTYVDQVGGNVDAMLRQGSGHFQRMTAAAQVASLTGGNSGGGAGGNPNATPRTGLDGVSTVNSPGTLPNGMTGLPGGGAPAPVDIQGFQPGGTVPGGLGGPSGGGVPGMPGGPLAGPGGGGGGGGTPALQPFKMPTAQTPGALGGGGAGGFGGGGAGGFGGGAGSPSLGADGRPEFKLPPVGSAPGLTLAGHQPPSGDTTTGLTRPSAPLRPFTPGGADPSGTLGGLGGLRIPGGGMPGGTPVTGRPSTGGLTGRPAGLPGGSLTGRGNGTAFNPGGGRTPGGVGGSPGGSGLGGGRSGGVGGGGGASALGGYSPGGRSAGGAGSPVTAGGAGAGASGRGAGGGLGAGGTGAGGSGAAGSSATSGRGAAGGGMPGMHGMGGGAGAGAGAKSGSRFVRPTRFGVEEDEEETVALRDAGIVGQAVHHDPQDRQWQRMRQRWIQESGLAPAGELPQTVAAGNEESAPAATGGDLMSQLAAAVLGPEGGTTLNAPSEQGGSGSGGSGDGTSSGTGGGASGSGSGSGSSEDAYLDRARSVAERRGRPDEEPTVGATAAAAPAAPAAGPPPLREEEGFPVPTPFMRAALARLATSGAFPDGGGDAPAAGSAGAGATGGQGR